MCHISDHLGIVGMIFLRCYMNQSIELADLFLENGQSLLRWLGFLLCARREYLRATQLLGIFATSQHVLDHRGALPCLLVARERVRLPQQVHQVGGLESLLQFGHTYGEVVPLMNVLKVGVVDGLLSRQQSWGQQQLQQLSMVMVGIIVLGSLLSLDVCHHIVFDQW